MRQSSTVVVVRSGVASIYWSQSLECASGVCCVSHTPDYCHRLFESSRRDRLTTTRLSRLTVIWTQASHANVQTIKKQRELLISMGGWAEVAASTAVGSRSCAGSRQLTLACWEAATSTGSGAAASPHGFPGAKTASCGGAAKPPPQRDASRTLLRLP